MVDARQHVNLVQDLLPRGALALGSLAWPRERHHLHRIVLLLVQVQRALHHAEACRRCSATSAEQQQAHTAGAELCAQLVD